MKFPLLIKFTVITIFLLPIFLSFGRLNRVYAEKQSAGFTDIVAGSLGIAITGFEGDCGDICTDTPNNLGKYMTGADDGKGGNSAALLPVTSKYLGMIYTDGQISSQEYIADLFNNIGIPQLAQPAYAQGTGYTAMQPFLEFWKVFRNLAYSLYIVMFVVVGIMIMLRTKVNAQTVITIQSALPNLIITLLLITFSYAIVGFMIDLMYFLIYFLVYLLSSINLIQTPTQAIERLMTHSAWSVVFAGRNSIVSAVALAIREIVTGISGLTAFGRTAAGVVTLGISEIFTHALPYLLVAIWLAVAMLKLMWLLLKSYVMLIVQTVTAPVQILMNAIPGSKAFSEWLKKTASYLLPFPVAGAMFIIAAVFIGDPTKSTILGSVGIGGEANPFGINQNHPFYAGWDNNTIWLPPFTLNGTSDWSSRDIMVLLGFFIFTMTPAAVKMAQDWLQVKESPYTSEIGATFGLAKVGLDYPGSYLKQTRALHEQRSIQEYGAKKYAQEAEKLQRERQESAGK